MAGRAERTEPESEWELAALWETDWTNSSCIPDLAQLVTEYVGHDNLGSTWLDVCRMLGTEPAPPAMDGQIAAVEESIKVPLPHILAFTSSG